ncbi:MULTISPECIES: dynamin family protein [unclassified Moraxella]|uniref:dynamin family protein n=1 Tax=unclassified Moraxella TaxID=2685852 RepID=UPI003AF53100
MSVESMNLDDINGYKKTTLQILNKQIEILQSLDGILKQESKDKDDSKQGILTVEKSHDFQQILKNEITKLEKFDVVLAVVGTMKAGKSTTINAIVGREILPNRNRPMTALPTLICHKPNQTTPTLTINPTVINNFLEKLKDKLHLVPKSEAMHEDMKRLIDFVSTGGKFQTLYTGEQSIFDFLYMLNDLVRLSKKISDIQENQDETAILHFPFDEYKNFENLPRIDVAFNLEGDFETAGRFMLLDTAGPNEAGQDELKEALAQQLERSSAVMIVLDYTQLNSDAEKDVKEQISKIPTVQKSRLFALVNKFDQKNANADDADSTRTHIFHNLLKDRIELDNIYAISASNHYLAERMATQINNDKSIPAYEKNTWIADFAHKAFGEDAEDDYPDASLDKIVRKVESVRKKGRMSEPLNNIVINMQKNAPFIAMQSALAGASHVFDNLHNTLDIRGFFAKYENMSAQEIDRLTNLLNDLKAQKEHWDISKQELINKVDESKRNILLKVNLEDKLKIISLETQRSISNMFEEEMNTAKKQEMDALAQNKGINRIINILTPKSEAQVAKEKEDLDKIRARAKSDGNNLVFSSEADLKEFKEKAVKTVEKFVDDNVVQAFDSLLDESIEAVKELTNDINQNSLKLLKEIKSDFSEEGIDLRIDFDAMKNLQKQKAKVGSIDLKERRKDFTERRQESGFFGKAKRGLGGLFGKSWGTYTVEYSTFTISKQKTIDLLIKIIDKEFLFPLRKQVEDKTQELLKQSTDYIDNFGKKVTEIVNETQKGIQLESEIKSKSKDEQQSYKNTILQAKHDHDTMKADWESVAEKFKVEEIKSA